MENHSNAQFNPNEITLLNKGLQYNSHARNNKWTETLAIKADAAISQINIQEQQYYKYAIAKTLEKLIILHKTPKSNIRVNKTKKN